MSHQRNNERKSSEAKLNLFPFLRLSPWVGVEESRGREKGFVGKHISLYVCPVVQDYKLQSGEPSAFHAEKKKIAALLMAYQVGGNKGDEREKKEVFTWHTTFPNHILFLFYKRTFIMFCSLTPWRGICPKGNMCFAWFGGQGERSGLNLLCGV